MGLAFKLMLLPVKLAGGSVYNEKCSSYSNLRSGRTSRPGAKLGAKSDGSAKEFCAREWALESLCQRIDARESAREVPLPARLAGPKFDSLNEWGSNYVRRRQFKLVHS